MPLHVPLVATGSPEQPHAAQAIPEEHPGLSAPKRKCPQPRPAASSQAPGHPLTAAGISLAAACRLRRSCRRDRGPVALRRSGCPVRRSRRPAAFAEPPAPLLPPLPAAFCGRVPRRCRDPRPQNAVPYQNNNQPTNYQPRPPALRAARCFGLRVHSGPSRKVCASRTFVYCPPCAVGPRGPGALLFTAARGSRALSACEKKAGGSAPSDPRVAREACRRRNPPESVMANVKSLIPRAQGHSPGGRVPDPRLLLRIHRARGLHRLDPTLGSCRSRRQTAARHSAEALEQRRARHGWSHRGRRRPTYDSRAPRSVGQPITASRQARPLGLCRLRRATAEKPRLPSGLPVFRLRAEGPALPPSRTNKPRLSSCFFGFLLV